MEIALIVLKVLLGLCVLVLIFGALAVVFVAWTMCRAEIHEYEEEW